MSNVGLRYLGIPGARRSQSPKVQRHKGGSSDLSLAKRAGPIVLVCFPPIRSSFQDVREFGGSPPTVTNYSPGPLRLGPFRNAGPSRTVPSDANDAIRDTEHRRERLWRISMAEPKRFHNSPELF